MLGQRTAHSPYIWLLSDGKAGHINQLRALAQAMNAEYTEINSNNQDIDSKTLKNRKPEIILSIARAGRKMQFRLDRELPAMLSGTKRVHVMSPKKQNNLFDLEIVMAHDVPEGYAPKSRQILCFMPPSPFGAGAQSNVALPELKCAQYVTLLLGGKSKAFRFDANDALNLGEKIKKILLLVDLLSR